MPAPRRRLQEAVEETLTPPDVLNKGQFVARVVGANGKNLYTVESASQQSLLVELEPKFRSKIWLKRGGYVLIDTTTLADRENKIDGEIINIVRDERAWRKAAWWPKEFVKKSTIADEEADEESTVGKMPSSDSENG